VAEPRPWSRPRQRAAERRGEDTRAHRLEAVPVESQGTRRPRGMPDPRTTADDGTMRPAPGEQRRAVARATRVRQKS